MIARLVLRHEIVRNLTKPLLITVVTVSLVLNILAFQMAQESSSLFLDGYRGVLAQFAFLVPVVMILLLGKAPERCRRWEAGLPLATGPLWWSHLLALVFSFLMLILVTGVSFLGFGFLIGVFSNEHVLDLADLLRLVTRPVAASLMAACLIAAWRPGLGLLADETGWLRHRFVVIFFSAALLGLLLVLPPLFSLLPVVLAVVIARRTASGLPAALTMTGGADGGGESAWATEMNADWSAVGPSRRVVWLTILRTLFKWPLNWLALMPFTFLFGLMMSGYGILGLDEPYIRFLNFFMSVYILFASVNHFAENLYKVDHLPIDRRILLRWLVVPVAGIFMLGYGTGRVMESYSPDRQEKVSFENTDESYGLKVPAEFFSFTTSPEPNLVSSPAGETHEVVAFQVFKGLPGVLWKPYGTPAGASLDFVSWQISRAAVAVYGLEITPEEISARYLEKDLNGLVTVREPGLTLVTDFPQAGSSGLGPVFPLLVGGVLVLFLGLLALFFMVFKPGVTIRKMRVVFWFLMGGLMGLHIGGYVFFMAGLTKEWLISGFLLGRMREIGALGPAGYGAVWLVMILLVWAAWRLAQRMFLAAEAPSS